MHTLTFYKDNNEWFLKWPYESSSGKESPMKSELEMVLGADKLLDTLSENKDLISLDIVDNVQEARASDEIFKKKEGWDYLIRADYVKTYSGAYYTTGFSENSVPYIWLCPVTTLLFEGYPKIIYYKIHKNEKI